MIDIDHALEGYLGSVCNQTYDNCKIDFVITIVRIPWPRLWMLVNNLSKIERKWVFNLVPAGK